MTQQHLRRSEESPSSSNYSDDVKKAGKGAFEHRTYHVPGQESATGESGVTMQSYTRRGIKKNPLNPGKDRLFVSPVDAGSIYFPNQVARVSYVAAVVKPDANGEYIKDLQDGMESLATRLAPSYFPGTVVRAITTQVDGYSPAACPSEEFANCQDVTASIGLYLNALPIEKVENDRFGSYNSNANTVDPSTMTEELIAFQESFEAAIANNELQEAIRQEYFKHQHDDGSPPVVIVSEYKDIIDVVVDNGSEEVIAVNNNVTTNASETDGGEDVSSVAPVSVGNTTSNTGINDIELNVPTESDGVVPVTIDDNVTSAGTADIALERETTVTIADPASASAAIQDEEDVRNIGMATGGVIGTVLASLILVALLAVSRRRRRNENLSGPDSIMKSKTKVKRDSKRRSDPKITIDSGQDGNDYDQSKQTLLRNVYVADSNDGNEEDGYTGRTTRTVETASTSNTGYTQDSTSTQEVLVPIIESDSSTYSLNTAETEIATTSDIVTSNQTTGDAEMFIMEPDSETGDLSTDMIATVAADAKDDLISFDNNQQALSNQKESEFKVYSYDDDDKEYVMGEDDASDSSVGEHLLSVSKSSEAGQSSSRSLEVIDNPTSLPSSPSVSDLIASHEARRKGIDASDSPSNSTPSKSRQRSLSITSSNDSARSLGTNEDFGPLGELDLAIANGDWAAVGAAAAIIASGSAPVDQTTVNRRTKRRSSSASFTDFHERATEIDRLVAAEDWEAVVITAARFEVEGGGMGEDGSRSCLSRSSTQGSETHDSDANESYTSHMDYSSVGDRSMNMGRSVTTSGSQKERLQQIRDKVVQMVRDVVPDEVDNVEEMMMQFKGKEEELLETLRSMKERDVARKARLESQKLARRNTRAREKNEGFPSLDQTMKLLEAEQPYDSDAIIRDLNNGIGPSVVSDGDDETDGTRHLSVKEFGSFENATKVDPDTAAAAAAAWAIQRSLDEMMEKDEQSSK